MRRRKRLESGCVAVAIRQAGRALGIADAGAQGAEGADGAEEAEDESARRWPPWVKDESGMRRWRRYVARERLSGLKDELEMVSECSVCKRSIVGDVLKRMKPFDGGGPSACRRLREICGRIQWYMDGYEVGTGQPIRLEHKLRLVELVRAMRVARGAVCSDACGRARRERAGSRVHRSHSFLF